MIRYRMMCDDGHGFDAWFRSAEDCDAQIDRGLVTCGACGSNAVKKALMAPRVRTSKKAAAPPPPEPEAKPEAPAASPPSLPVAAMPPEAQKVLGAMRKLREMVTENAHYVGPRFAEEARKIHYGEAEARGIYGEATSSEVEALEEDGVDIMPLPVLPEERN